MIGARPRRASSSAAKSASRPASIGSVSALMPHRRRKRRPVGMDPGEADPRLDQDMPQPPLMTAGRLEGNEADLGTPTLRRASRRSPRHWLAIRSTPGRPATAISTHSLPTSMPTISLSIPAPSVRLATVVGTPDCYASDKARTTVRVSDRDAGGPKIPSVSIRPPSKSRVRRRLHPLTDGEPNHATQ